MSAAIKSKTVFKIVPIIKNDEITVIEFLQKFFTRDEPLNAAINLIKEEDVAIRKYINGLFDNGEWKKAVLNKIIN